MLVDKIKKIITNNKKIILAITLIVFFLIGCLIISKCLNSPKVEEVLLEESIVMEEEIIVDKYYVDIKGAVKKPGVYQMNRGDRVTDAITMAGGLTKDANTNSLNLSKKILDEMFIIIYTNKQIEEFKKSSELVCPENICICPDEKTNDACANETDSNLISNNLLSINTATIDELQTLPGIGDSKAKAIIEYRNTNGNFKKIEDIMNVSGIGLSIYEKIKLLIVI